MIEKIVSGGQTGVDRAGLDSAIALGIEYGGWCPKGRLDELGIIPEQYIHLVELEGEYSTEKEKFDARTKQNIVDSDGTLIIVPQIPLPIEITDGTLLTITEVEGQQKPFLMIDSSGSQEENAHAIADWIHSNGIKILNVAGPRESSSRGIYNTSLALITLCLKIINSGHSLDLRTL